MRSNEEDENLQILGDQMQCYCDFDRILRISSLKTGRSTLVTGDVQIIKPPRGNSITPEPAKAFQFKVEDKSVSIFAKGASKAVL